MGCICSCFASVFLWTGELVENLLLAIGEISSILARGIFSVLVALCDLLASISCCWRVPYAERPDRSTYDFQSVQTLAKPSNPSSMLTKAGREQRAAEKQQRSAAQAERRLKAQEQRQKDDLAKKEEKEARAKVQQEGKEAKKAEELKAKEKALAEKKANQGETAAVAPQAS